MPSTNILMLQTVANGLGELKDEMVFVGGAVAELYADNPAASEIRPTIDVDCVIEISTLPPSSAALPAANNPAGPAPTTITSKLLIWCKDNFYRLIALYI